MSIKIPTINFSDFINPDSLKYHIDSEDLSKIKESTDPFTCPICCKECTRKTTYTCCNKEVCYKCRTEWKSRKHNCPFCRANDD